MKGAESEQPVGANLPASGWAVETMQVSFAFLILRVGRLRENQFIYTETCRVFQNIGVMLETLVGPKSRLESGAGCKCSFLKPMNTHEGASWKQLESDVVVIRSVGRRSGGVLIAELDCCTVEPLGGALQPG